MIVFPQYSAGMGICLDLNKTGAPALNLLTVNLLFMHCYFHVIFFPTSSIVCTIECLAY